MTLLASLSSRRAECQQNAVNYQIPRYFSNGASPTCHTALLSEHQQPRAALTEKSHLDIFIETVPVQFKGQNLPTV